MKKILFSIALFATVLVASAQGGVYLNEGFEDSEFPPLGWTVLALQGDDTPVHHETGGACGSNHSAAIMYNEYWYYGHCNRYFISPRLSPAPGDSLIFWLRTNPYSYNNTFTVEVSTGGLATWEFSVLRSFSVSDFQTSGWIRFAVWMGHFAGQNVYVAFHDAQDKGTSVCIDEVSGVRLYEPSCDTIVVTDNNFYTEDFSVLPECWNLTVGTNSWGYNSAGGYLSHSGGIYSCDAISPVLDISGLTSPCLRFAQMRPHVYIQQNAVLTVSYRNANVSGLWVPLVTYYDDANDWRYDSVPLPTDIARLQLKFTVVGITNNSGNKCYFDDVMVYRGEVPSYNMEPSVTTRAASNVQSHTATLNGKIDNPYYFFLESMGFEWKEASDSIFTQVFTDTSQYQIPFYTMPISCVLTNLSETTEYVYRTFITYNDTTIYGNEVEFTTYSCDAPTGLHATDVGLDYFILEWDNDTNVETWHLKYYGDSGIPDGGELFTETNSATVHYEFQTMDMHHQGVFLHTPLYYQFAVQAYCGDSIWGPWSDAITVATPYVGISERLKNSVTVFPNPASSYVDIRVDGEVIVMDMEVYDLYGKLVLAPSGAENETSQQTTRINVSDLSAGMYFIRVNTDQGPVTKPFVIH